LDKEIYKLENTDYTEAELKTVGSTEAEIIEKRSILKDLQEKQSLLEKNKADYQNKKVELDKLKKK
jgi:hypothetical protein